METREIRIKRCQRCGQMFGCPYGIGIGVWRKRKFCSIKCSVPLTTIYRHKKCLTCGKEFYCPKGTGISEWNKRRFCSHKCSKHQGMFKKGQIPWNKGKNGYFSEEAKKRISEARKDKHNSPKTEFKKGNSGFWLGKKRPNLSEENHFNWKGNNVGYHALHKWVRKKLGEPQICKICQKNKLLEWANVDHKYKRNLIDWMAICHSCHSKYDKEHKLRRNST